MDIADLVVESMTQTPEEIKEALGNEYEAQPPEGTPPAAAPPAAAEAAPPAEAAAPPPPVAEPELAAPPAEPKKPSGYKLKFERTQALLREREQELETLRAQNGGHSAAGIVPREPEAAAPPAAAAPVPPAPAAAVPAPPAAAAPAATFDKPKPNVEDFDFGSSDPAYIDAISDWNYDRRKFADDQAAQAARTTETRAAETARNTADEQAANAQFAQSFDEAKTRHADYDAVLAMKHPKLIWNGMMTLAMRSLPHAGELAYWLATHPDEANEIHQLTVISDPNAPKSLLQRKYAVAVGELSKIDLGLDAAPPAPEPPAPAAEPASAAPAAPVAAAGPAKSAPPVKPEPITPVGSRGTSHAKPVERLSADEVRALDPDEYRRKRGVAQ